MQERKGKEKVKEGRKKKGIVVIEWSIVIPPFPPPNIPFLRLVLQTQTDQTGKGSRIKDQGPTFSMHASLQIN